VLRRVALIDCTRTRRQDAKGVETEVIGEGDGGISAAAGSKQKWEEIESVSSQSPPSRRQKWSPLTSAKSVCYPHTISVKKSRLHFPQPKP
jgi:hypothetical protein